MKTINKNTKQGQSYINAYNYAKCANINSAYSRPSSRKLRAWMLCYEQYLRENGRGIRITGYNCMKFTVAWMTDKGLRVETACNSYLIA